MSTLIADTAETTDYAKVRMEYAISVIHSTAGTPGSNRVVEFLESELNSIEFQRIGWPDLSTTERSLLRFTWEFVYRTPCPFSLFPEG